MTQGSVDARPHVLIVGGGFGGLTAAKSLAGAPVRVTLIDRTNHHTFQPLLYQVAMAGLSPAEIAQPIRSILRTEPNVTVLMADASRIDLGARRVRLADGATLDWDFLILACGVETSYFGHDEWAPAAPGLKSIEDAIDIRQRVLLAFELAEREENAARREELLSFVVIGGGPTGVELAGALAELSKFVLDRDFRNIDPSAAKVRLLEAGPRILPSFPEDLAESAVSQLHELGVEVQTGALVTSIEPGYARMAGGKTLPASVVLWAAGVRANGLTQSLGAPLDKSGRVIVGSDLSVPGHPRAFVIGDAARLDGKDGKPLPGVSPVAMQQARTVAKSIRRALLGKDTLTFEYFDKGSMATIGRRRAIAMVERMRLSGFLAWMAWLLVHIWYLIGFKNRLIVMFIWAWSYFTYRRGSRLITGHGASDAMATLRLPPFRPAEREAPPRAHESPPRVGGPAAHA
jgi:NADH dehydrogenase